MAKKDIAFILQQKKEQKIKVNKLKNIAKKTSDK